MEAWLSKLNKGQGPTTGAFVYVPMCWVRKRQGARGNISHIEKPPFPLAVPTMHVRCMCHLSWLALSESEFGFIAAQHNSGWPSSNSPFVGPTEDESAIFKCNFSVVLVSRWPYGGLTRWGMGLESRKRTCMATSLASQGRGLGRKLFWLILIRTRKLTIFALSATQELRFRGSSGQNAQFLPRTSLP